MSRSERDASVLESQRTATAYRILVEVAQRQPAVSQQEIADVVGITSQAVSDYLSDLADDDYVDKLGRGRYEITKAGVDWLISETDSLRAFADHVVSDVVEDVEVETAIATARVDEGERVSLTMRDGLLHAVPGQEGTATAMAVTDAEPGEDVGVTNFEGVIDHDLGTVTVFAVPPVREGGGTEPDTEEIVDLVGSHDLVAVDSPEGLVAARRAEAEPDLRFGTERAVQDAATKGLDVLLLTTSTNLSSHTEALREHNLGYEVRDPVD